MGTVIAPLLFTVLVVDLLISNIFPLLYRVPAIEQFKLSDDLVDYWGSIQSP